MKVIQIFWLFTFVILTASSYSQEITKIKYDKSYDNKAYGTIHKKYLEKSQNIYGYPCKKGKVSFYDNDSLASLTLYKDFRIGDDIIPKGSNIKLYYTGHLEYVILSTSKNITIQGFKPKIVFFRYWDLSYYNNGFLRSITLKENTVIQGIPCSKDYGWFERNEYVSFYPDGKLFTCYLSKDFDIKGKHYKKGAHLIFNKNGVAQVYSDSLHRNYAQINGVKHFTKRFYKKEASGSNITK